MTNIIRLTRHPLQEEQLAVLMAAFPKATIETVSETLPSGPREAVARFDVLSASADVVEAVLPVNLLEAILKFSAFAERGGLVIRAITARTLDEAGNASFRFERYEVVERVEIVTRPLVP